ncbi:hypothetical protein PF010_g27324 [Phytophthora fragariae]|uniref:Uncharacterized protein n=2 Tax=Phytophthora fragariae TaxID=53985 RepID=A0A6A4BQB4_9STRA|nr:hypothetical protein PF003_g20500 [Phytophthora fragariae]KAE9067800.1 hypothetical protein PF010_g27324 [Phytophthora fragariae]KAE9274433.1 hypothetical protein PF001_g27063 [Phytophthora fragariae]
MAKRSQAAESEGTPGGAARQAPMTRNKIAAKATYKPATKRTSAPTDKSATLPRPRLPPAMPSRSGRRGRGRDTSPSPRKQRKTAKKTGEGSNGTTRELGAASASEDEATTRDEETTPLVPNHALRSTCLALQKKIADEKGEHRQGPQREAGDYYKMTDYQKRVWAEKYTAARNSGNDLDYEALSKLNQFKAFKNNPEELQRHELRC